VPKIFFVSDGSNATAGNILDILARASRIAVTILSSVYSDRQWYGQAALARPTRRGRTPGSPICPITASQRLSARPSGGPVILIYLCFPNNPPVQWPRDQLQTLGDYALANRR